MKLARSISLFILIPCVLMPICYAQEQATPKKTPRMSSDGASREYRADPNKIFSVSNNGNAVVVFAEDAKDYGDYWRLLSRQDKKGLQKAKEDGLYFTVAPGTRVQAIEFETVEISNQTILLARVRFLEGKYKNDEGWTEKKFLTPYEAKPNAQEPEKQFRLGQNLYIYNSSSGQAKTFLFTNAKAFEDVMELTDPRRKEIRYSEMLETGKVIAIPDQTPVSFVDTKYVRVGDTEYKLAQIKITGGKYEGHNGLVNFKDLKEF
jgi:hypothetical protein